MQAILSHVFNRLHRLETDMSVLQGKEKDLRTITTDGFAKTDNFYSWVRNQFEQTNQRFVAIDKHFESIEDQIDTLAVATNHRFDGLEGRLDKLDGRVDRLERHATDTNVKLDKILNHLAIA